jgi:RimJ/RimL family protein N-acetyltransferase
LPEVKLLRYTVSPHNEPSIAIITKFGFPLIGEQMDEEDGLELIYEVDVAGYLNLKA